MYDLSECVMQFQLQYINFLFIRGTAVSTTFSARLQIFNSFSTPCFSVFIYFEYGLQKKLRERKKTFQLPLWLAFGLFLSHHAVNSCHIFIQSSSVVINYFSPTCIVCYI